MKFRAGQAVRILQQMEGAVSAIVRGTDFGADFTTDLLTQTDPKSGKNLFELAVAIGRPNGITQILKLKPGTSSVTLYYSCRGYLCTLFVLTLGLRFAYYCWALWVKCSSFGLCVG